MAATIEGASIPGIRLENWVRIGFRAVSKRKKKRNRDAPAKDPVQASADGGRPLSLRGKLLRIAFGLAVGLILSELGIHFYNEWWVWTPYDRPPEYQVDKAHIRFAVLGGSTSKGSPYNGEMRFAGFEHNFTLLSVTQLLLERRYGYTNIKVDLYASGGWPVENSVKFYWKMAEYKPDVLVLYTGHNEKTGYYSSNMTPPPGALSFLGATNTGALLLRDLFKWQVDLDDREYEGLLFSENVLPFYEAAANKARYLGYVEKIIEHCQREAIFLIVVIPEGNYLFPPTRSIYQGPATRKDEALKTFKQAFYYKHFKDDADRALPLLEELTEFCGFADLYFELGEIYYRQGEIDKAREFLRKARDSDPFSVMMSSDYQQSLRELVRRHDVPSIDMHALLTQELGVELPDYSCFVDNVHLRMHVYEALNQQIIGKLQEHRFVKLDLPEKDLTIHKDDREQFLGLTEDHIIHAQARAHGRVVDEAAETFLRLTRLLTPLKVLRDLQAATPSPLAATFVNNKLPSLEKEVEAQRARLQKWIRQGNDSLKE